MDCSNYPTLLEHNYKLCGLAFPTIKRPSPYFPAIVVCFQCSVLIFAFLDFPQSFFNQPITAEV